MKKSIIKYSQKVLASILSMAVFSLGTTTAFATSNSTSSEVTGSSSVATSSSNGESSAQTEAETEKASQGIDAKGNGLFIDFDKIIDELGADADVKTVQSYLSDMLKEATEENFNTIYLDTWRSGRAAWYSDSIALKDPYGASIFDYVVQVAAKRELNVVLWIDPMWQGADAQKGENYTSPQAGNTETTFLDIDTEEGYLNAVNELHALLDSTERYSNVTGVLLETEAGKEGENFTEPYQDKTDAPRFRFTKQTGEIVKERGLEFGVLNTGFYGNQSSGDMAKSLGEVVSAWKQPVFDWLEGVGADYFMPGLNTTMGVADGLSYNNAGELVPTTNLKERLVFCEALFEGSEISWKPLIMQPNECDMHEMVSQVILMQNIAKDGFGYSDYTRLKSGKDDLIGRVGELLSDKELRDLSVDPTFRITRPSKDATIYTSTYYIMGIADPNKTLTVGDGEEVVDRGSNGVFGVYVDLKMGENTFTFKQGNEEKSITITRASQSGGETSPAKIGVITQSSMAPISDTPIFTETSSTLSLSCTGPSGATITAQVDGQTIKLSQEKSADVGVAAKFSGSTKIKGNYDETKVERIGQVVYTLEWEGKTKTFTSTGGYYAVGENAELYVKASDILTQTYDEPKTASSAASDYEYFGVMNLGTTARVKLGGEEDTLSTYALYGGGYVLKSKVGIVPTNELPSTLSTDGAFTISDVRFKAQGNSETIRLVGAGNSAFSFSKISRSGVQVNIYNVTMDAASEQKLTSIGKTFNLLSMHATNLAPKIYEYEGTSAVELTLSCEENLQGYDVEYDGEDTLITFHFLKTQEADSKKPLAGTTILLDPGHGGSDGGAPSPAQEWGPTEKDMTIQLAHRVRDQLEALGATVYLTREYDVRVELYDRAAMFEKLQPDYFISIHLNSLNENVNAGSIDGAKIYYYNDYSGGLAQEIVDDVAYRTGRDNNGIEEGAYVVVRPTAAPAVLCELGFLPNPMEYANMLREDDLDKTATGVVNGLTSYISAEKASVENAKNTSLK